MYLNLALSGSLSLTPHIAKSFSKYVLCLMVAVGNTHAGPSGRGTNHQDATFSFSCTDAMTTPHNAPAVPKISKPRDQSMQAQIPLKAECQAIVINIFVYFGPTRLQNAL
jgi:hypothetical protein